MILIIIIIKQCEYKSFYRSHLRWNSTMRRCFYHTDLGTNAVFHNFAIQIALIQYSGRWKYAWLSCFDSCQLTILWMSYIKDEDLPRHAWDTPPFLLIVSPTPPVQSVDAYVRSVNHVTTKRKKVDHIPWVWGSVTRALRARGSPAINSVTPHNSAASRAVFRIPKISHVILFSKKTQTTCSFQIGTKNPTKKKFIVEPRFFTSWTIANEKCTRAHVQENKSTYLSIYLSIWKPFWKRVCIYIL